MKSSTYLNSGYFILLSEADNDYDDLSFDKSDDNYNDNDDDDDVNDSIEQDEVTSEDEDEFEKYVYLLVNSDSGSIYDILAGRVLRAWTRRKSPAGSKFSISGWDISLQLEIMDNLKIIMNWEHRNKIQTVVQKIYADQEYDDVSK